MSSAEDFGAGGGGGVTVSGGECTCLRGCGDGFRVVVA